MEKSQPIPEFTPSDKEVPLHREVFYTEQKAEEPKEEAVTEKLKRELADLEREAGDATGEIREKLQKDIDAIRNELGQKEEAPKEQTRETPGEATKDARIDEIKAEIQQEEVKKEFESLPEADKEKVKLGLQNIGFYVEENKNRFFAKLFQGTRMAGIASGMLKEKGSLDRFLGALGENAEKDADLSKKRFEDAERNSLTQAASIGATIGNIAKYGRTVSDLVGWTATAPLRYVMMGSMLFGTGAGAAKEARFKNEEVLNKTRGHREGEITKKEDIEAAAEEAWKIYEQAKANKETISKEDLVKAYQANVPKDLLARLQKDPEPGTASGILQGFIKYDVDTSVKKINEKLEKIAQDKNLSEIDKKIKQEKILNKYSKHLNDLDRAVGRFGTVDALALGAKYAETGAKATVTAMTIETLSLSIYKLWENLPSIMETANEYLSGQNTTEGDGILTEYQEGKRFPMGERPVEVIAPAPEKLGEIEESFIVQKGEGIEHTFIRQLSDDPEKFGFTGDSKNDETVMDWAGKEAHRIAIKAGYVDLETGNEIRVGGKGGDIAYELAKDSSGGFKINEYAKDAEGNFKGIETNGVAKDLESAQFETDRESPEYEYAKPEEQTTIPATEAPIKESLIVPESSDEATAEYQPPIYDTPRSALGSETLGRGEVYAEGVEEPTQKYTYNMPNEIGSEHPVSVPGTEYQTLEDRAEATGGPTISEEPEAPEARVDPKVERAVNMPSVDHEQLLAIKTQQINNDIDKMFGSRGIFGLGKTSGIDSPDWKDPQVGFANKTVEEVIGTTSGKPRITSYGRGVERSFGIKSSAATREMQRYLTETFNKTQTPPEKGEKVAGYLNRTAKLSIKKS